VKKIEQRYRKLTDIEHCLARPGMWIGAIKPHPTETYLPDASGRYVKQEVTLNPAFLKIFDEIISNSADEHRRNPRLNRIDVTVDRETGRITVLDNGGIPVVKHGEYDCWVPELIFSELKAGSNFDDTEDRLVAGTNGVGSTLTNIFSQEFRVRTSDGTNLFEQTFTNNMRERSEAVIRPTKGKGFTEISYIPDYPRFSLTGLDDVHMDLIRKRCVDVAGCNPRLTVRFNDEVHAYPKFLDYCRLYVDNVMYESSERWHVGLAASDGGFQQVSFVNGTETRDGGTHVDYIVAQVVEHVRRKLEKKKIQVKPSEIRSQLAIFVQTEVVNPSFTSQTKEKLITDARDFGSSHTVTERTLKSVMDSEIVARILDWVQQKNLAKEREQLRELNKSISKSKVVKLIDAKSRTEREKCTLAIFEGDSASSAFRKYRDPMIQGAYPLRGKFLNVSEVPISEVIQNKEVKELLTAIALRLGEPPTDIRYGKILIYADADPDGDSIAGLLINFFGRFWPELLDQERICRVMTPLVVAKRGSEKKWFYTPTEFSEWSAGRKDLQKWQIEYKKGLAALEDPEYREIIQNPNYFAVTGGPMLKPTLDTWFGDDVLPRKKKILGGPAESTQEDE
jgi:DNA topoisomerase II